MSDRFSEAFFYIEWHHKQAWHHNLVNHHSPSMTPSQPGMTSLNRHRQPIILQMRIDWKIHTNIAPKLTDSNLKCILQSKPWVNPWILKPNWILKVNPWILKSNPWILKMNPWILKANPWILVSESLNPWTNPQTNPCLILESCTESLNRILESL